MPEDFLDIVDHCAAAPICGDASRRSTPRPGTPSRCAFKPRTPLARPFAGQYVRIGVDVAGVRQWRTYSVTTPTAPTAASPSPSKPSRAEKSPPIWSAERVSGPWCSSTGQPATSPCLPAAGQGTVRDRRQRHYPGDGHAARIRARTAADVVLVHSARSAEDTIFRGELRGLAGRGHLRLVERHTNTAARLTPDALTALFTTSPNAIPGPAARRHYSTPSNSTTRLPVSRINCTPNGSRPP